VCHTWIEKPHKNQPIFAKIGETSLDRFHRFSENRPVKFDFFKKIEIKILKKLESISRFLVKIELKN
jgi:hypothetical protein